MIEVKSIPTDARPLPLTLSKNKAMYVTPKGDVYCHNLGTGRIWKRARRYNNVGYVQISVPLASGHRSYLEHHLVWLTFCGPIPSYLQLDHINGVRDDNRISNLRLVTGSENIRYGLERRRTAQLLTQVQ